jgi:hypothetical protein
MLLITFPPLFQLCDLNDNSNSDMIKLLTGITTQLDLNYSTQCLNW